jgi:hypothetical protein
VRYLPLPCFTCLGAACVLASSGRHGSLMKVEGQ